MGGSKQEFRFVDWCSLIFHLCSSLNWGSMRSISTLSPSCCCQWAYRVCLSKIHKEGSRSPPHPDSRSAAVAMVSYSFGSWCLLAFLLFILGSSRGTLHLSFSRHLQELEKFYMHFTKHMTCMKNNKNIRLQTTSPCQGEEGSNCTTL